jgi:hypothetical protein
MRRQSVAIILRRAECEAHWLPADETRWQAWLTDDEPPELAFYCPGCAEREFGDGGGLLERPGAHAALSGVSSRRSSTSRLSSSRKRAQSFRRSSETNSPGSRGSGEGGDPAA